MFDRLDSRSCPVCDAGPEAAAVFLKHSVDFSRLNEFTYSSRKTPEFTSFELLACTRCKTVYASFCPPPEALARAYQEAQFDSAEEASLAADTYGRALSPFLARLPSFTRALEIGTGTGAFLSVLQRAGFAEVIGVEPSQAAVDAADPQLRPFIRRGVFLPEAFEPESFDLICCFQTLEHVPNPRRLVESSARLLRKGGMLALVTHNYQALINRALGRRSPINDIEHLQLFCPDSLTWLLCATGLELLGLRSFSNRYPLRYWLRLAPLSARFKSIAGAALSAFGLDELCVRLNVGNLLIVARNPS